MPQYPRVRLARSAARNVIQREAYRRAGRGPRRYGNAVLVLDTLCNSVCGMCSSHSVRTKPGTLTSAQWIVVIDKLLAHNRDMKLSIVGGEPLMAEGIFDVLAHLHGRGAIFSMVTNGTLLTEDAARRILAAEPLALHVSLDSLDAATYADIRGLDALPSVLANVARLAEIAAETGTRTHLGLKATVTDANVGEIGALTDYAADLGVSIHFQPVLDDNKVARRRMQLDRPTLEVQTARLREGVASGAMAHVANGPSHLDMWGRYFDGKETERPYCPTSLENLFIMANGDVRLCERYRRTVGNAYTDGITELISGDAAVELRAETFGCKRNCSFIYKRGAADYVRLAKVMRH